ncbi:MAG: ABC transporter ATP-binding protein [Clostridia bacterium]
MQDKEQRDIELIQKYPAKQIVGRLLSDTKNILKGLILAIFFSLISVAAWLVAPEILGQTTNILNEFHQGIIAELPKRKILILGLILLICYVIKAISDTGKMVLMNNHVSRYFTANLRIKLSEKIKRLPVSFVDKTPFGEIISRMTNDVSRMGTTVHSVLDMAIMGVLQIFLIGTLMFLKNWVLALVVVITVPVSFIISSKISFLAEKHYGELRKQAGKMYSHIEEHYGGFRTVKAYNLEQRQEVKNFEITEKYRKAGERSFFYSELVQPIISLSNNICFIVICVIGGLFAINKIIDVGSIVTIILYSRLLSGPIESIASSMSMFQQVLASSRRVYHILDIPEMEQIEQPIKKESTNGNVTFDHIAFSYSDEPLITDLSFEVKSGQKVAIVGPTGGGKTTLVNLLMRFYDIQKGTIEIDGLDIMKMSREDLRSMFSMVLQDTWLFNGTIYDNIAYGKEGATQEQIEHACDMSYCDHFIRTLPQGYQTLVNNDITIISAGQKQLLTIARAFLSDRKILILDEATSNVDTRTEILIQKAMDQLMAGRTSFVIAHRLSTIIDADLILVINNGNIIEQGTHKDLLSKKGFYYDLYQSQYSLVVKDK